MNIELINYVENSEQKTVRNRNFKMLKKEKKLQFYILSLLN